MEPAGSWLAYAVKQGSTLSIKLASASSDSTLSFDSSNDAYPWLEWSPDGKHLVAAKTTSLFDVSTPSPWQLDVIEIDGKVWHITDKLSRMVGHGTFTVFPYYYWSADGQTIIFANNTQGRQTDLMAFQLDKGESILIQKDSGLDITPDHRYAFATLDDGTANKTLILDTNTLHRVDSRASLETGGNQLSSITVDSTIIFSWAGGVRLAINAVTGESYPLDDIVYADAALSGSYLSSDNQYIWQVAPLTAAHWTLLLTRLRDGRVSKIELDPRVKFPGKYFQGVVLTPDDSAIILVSYDSNANGTISVLDHDGRLIRELGIPWDIPSQRTLMSATNCGGLGT